MSIQIGDRVRTNRRITVSPEIPELSLGTVVGERNGLPGGLAEVVLDDPALQNVSRAKGAGWFIFKADLELVAPEKQPTEQLSGNFSLHGFGLTDLLLFAFAFQDAGEEKFKIEWTLSGTAGESGSL